MTITNRHDERATRLAEEVGCRTVTWSMRASNVADVVINATPVGMHPNVDDTPLPPAAFSRPGIVVFDTIYHPENTMMIKLARERGCPTVTGVDMFIRQAAPPVQAVHGSRRAHRRDGRRPQTQAHRRSAKNDTRPRAARCLERRVRDLALVGYRGTGKSTVGRILADRAVGPSLDCRS